MRRLLARCAAATALVAAAIAVPALPAQAAACPTATGVTVVVDFGSLGGGAGQGCVSGGGGDRASSLFPAAGFPLTYVASGGGFVCRVSGKPADDPCQNTPPADRYWALWWSDGSGSWSYSSRGVGSLRVPDGGSVAFVWDDVSGNRAPGVSPPTHSSSSPSSSPTPKPTPNPGTKPSTKPTAKPKPTTAATADEASTTPSASASASPSATPSTGPSATATPTTTSATAEPSPTESVTAAAVASDPAEPDGGLPAWVGPAVLVVLFGAGAAVLVVRRRRTTAP